MRYGPGSEHVADLRLPRDGPGRSATKGVTGGGAPLVLFLHGGFWRAEYDRFHVAPLAVALAEAGYAACTPEFRRVGQPGGGWPGTFDDVALAVDVLPTLVSQAGSPGLDAGTVILAGHSAGGHLGLWAAARRRIPPGRPWHVPDGGSLAGVVALAPVSDLAACYTEGVGDGAAGELMGGGPDRYPGRYALGDPARLLPAGVRARVVHGTEDDRVPCGMSRDYVTRAVKLGDEVVLDGLPGIGHFELIDPETRAWTAVLGAFRAIAAPSG